MAQKTHMNSIAARQFSPTRRGCQSARVIQLPQIRNAGVKNLAIAGQHARANPVHPVLESVCKHFSFVRNPVPVTVNHQLHPVMVKPIFIRLLFQLVLVHPIAVCHSAASQVRIQPIHVVANVSHTRMQPISLGHKAPALVVKSEGNWVGQQRFRRPQPHFHAFRHFHPLDRGYTFTRCGRNFWAIGLAISRFGQRANGFNRFACLQKAHNSPKGQGQGYKTHGSYPGHRFQNDSMSIRLYPKRSPLQKSNSHCKITKKPGATTVTPGMRISSKLSH